MLSQKLLADIIREKVPLGKLSNTGYYAVRCPVCADYQARGGFKFDESTCYNDFNCGAKFCYEEGSGKLSRNAREILAAFGITREDLNELTSSLFMNQAERTEKEISLSTLTKVKLHTPEVAFPDSTYPLLSAGNDDLQAPLVEYLLARKIDPVQTQFYYSLEPRLARRVIIPFWRGDKLIYWQARAIDQGVRPRYVNCVVSKEAVIYGHDKLFTYEVAPLFVTEGVFNALLVDGASIMGASLNAAKVEVLKRSRRRLIFVRDRDPRGDLLSQQVLENGWELTTVDPRVNDVNESVQEFGLLYTAYSLIKNVQDPRYKIQSNIELNLWGLEDRLRNQK